MLKGITEAEIVDDTEIVVTESQAQHLQTKHHQDKTISRIQKQIQSKGDTKAKTVPFILLSALFVIFLKHKKPTDPVD